MALVKRVQLENQFVMIPNETARHCETEMSLEAGGILLNLTSYPETWELHKTELYKRYAKNKETSVRKAWNQLVELGYIIEYKYRVGRKWEYVYYVRVVPFSEAEKAQILETARSEHSEIWGLDFKDPKMKTSKSSDNKKGLKKKGLKKYNNTKDIDDDKRTSPSENSSVKNEQDINQTISTLRQAYKGKLSKRSFDSVLRKVMDKYNQGKVDSFRDYLATSLSTRVKDLETRKIKEKAKSAMNESKHRNKTVQSKGYDETINKAEYERKVVPFYNWLES
jgi:hypothetical protein